MTVVEGGVWGPLRVEAAKTEMLGRAIGPSARVEVETAGERGSKQTP